MAVSTMVISLIWHVFFLFVYLFVWLLLFTTADAFADSHTHFEWFALLWFVENFHWDLAPTTTKRNEVNKFAFCVSSSSARSLKCSGQIECDAKHSVALKDPEHAHSCVKLCVDILLFIFNDFLSSSSTIFCSLITLLSLFFSSCFFLVFFLFHISFLCVCMNASFSLFLFICVFFSLLSSFFPFI